MEPPGYEDQPSHPERECHQCRDFTRWALCGLRSAEGEKQSLNVRQVATGSDVQILPPDEVMIWGLTFSPDANYIDFVRSEKPNFRTPFSIGCPCSAEHHILRCRGDRLRIQLLSRWSAVRFFAGKLGPGKVDVLIAKADGSDERVLATRPYRDEFIGVAWSPDGKTIAFTTSEATKGLRSVLWAISVADGSVREIYSTPDAIGRPRWLPDGSGLLAPIGNAGQAFRGQLWFISYPRGEARRLTNDLMDYQLCCLDLTPDGKTLVDTELTTVSDLWVAPAETPQRLSRSLRRSLLSEAFPGCPTAASSLPARMAISTR